MKSLSQMDLEEWELLPDEGYLEINDDGGKKIYSRKYPDSGSDSGSGSNGVFQMNYFICPQITNPQFVETTGHLRVPNQLMPVPIDSGLTTLQETTTSPVEIKITAPSAAEKIESFNSVGDLAGDQDPVSQVFFKKMKEAEFVDMKVESPRSGGTNNWGIVPQVEAFQFEEKREPCKEANVDPSDAGIKNNSEEFYPEESEDTGGLNIWKWSLTGIGAICSFGVAAATVCIIVLSNHQKNNKHLRQNQKLQFQIYTSDKRIKHVVHHANKLNEAISAARGVPITRANITFGGYYDAPV